MSIYITSDIHGMYGKFINLLETIDLGDDDTLYVLGDMVDRGTHPIRVIQKIMSMKNVKTIMGKHDSGVIGSLKFLVENESIEGGSVTEKEFQMLTHQEKLDVKNSCKRCKGKV